MALVSIDGDLIETINSENYCELVGVFDFQKTLQKKTIKIIGEDTDWKDWHRSNPNIKCIIAVDSPQSRRELVSIYGANNIEGFCSANAYVSQNSAIEPGVILQRDTYVSGGVHIGKYSKINIGASVHHDCLIGQFVTFAPGARLLGNVCIEDNVYIGAGAIVLPGLRVGSGSVVGAGAVVTKSVKKNDIVAGVPAASVKR